MFSVNLRGTTAKIYAYLTQPSEATFKHALAILKDIPKYAKELEREIEVARKKLPRQDAHTGPVFKLRVNGRVVRSDIDKTALANKILQKLNNCHFIVDTWDKSKSGNWLKTGDASQIEADKRAIEEAQKFIDKAESLLSKLK